MRLPGSLETGWQGDVDLAAFNTLSIPAVATRFYQVRSVEQLWHSLQACRDAGHPRPLILGGGSNLLLTKRHYPAVIHLQMTGVAFGANGQVTVAAGENWHAFVQTTLAHQLYGLENLALIPGSCGAAPIQNIGAYGVEVGEFITGVTALNRHHGALHYFPAQACDFAYRQSYFKSSEGRDWVVVSLDFQLHPDAELNLSYPELRQAWEAQQDWLSEAELSVVDAAQRLAHVVAALRRRKLPDPTMVPNAGSFFKNPIVNAEQFSHLVQQWPGLVGFPLEDGGVKLAAGWLIDQAGHKGVMSAGLGLHDRQALVLINPGRRPGREVLAFARTIQDNIARRFGVNLEIEPDQY